MTTHAHGSDGCDTLVVQLYSNAVGRRAVGQMETVMVVAQEMVGSGSIHNGDCADGGNALRDKVYCGGGRGGIGGRYGVLQLLGLGFA